MLWMWCLLACSSGTTESQPVTPTDSKPDDSPPTDSRPTGGTDSGGTDTGLPTAVLQQGFEAALTSTDGCSDSTVHAWDPAGNVGLELYVEGLLAEAEANGGHAQRVLTVGVDTVWLRVEVAEPIAINYCTDALSERTEIETWEAVSGTVTVDMTVSGVPNDPGLESFTLSNVVFRDARYRERTVETMTRSDIPVVWQWGG